MEGYKGPIIASYWNRVCRTFVERFNLSRRKISMAFEDEVAAKFYFYVVGNIRS